MSFCSYEEAWGAPFQPSQNTTNELQSEKHTMDVALQKPIHNTDSENSELAGSTTVKENLVVEAPLRGDLLGGNTHNEAWKTQEVTKQPDFSEIIASKIDSKFDALIVKLDKYFQSIHSKFVYGDNPNGSSWTDVFIFIAIGIAAIIILDMFFRFGKWWMQHKLLSSNNVPRLSPQQMHQYHPMHFQQQMTHPTMPNYLHNMPQMPPMPSMPPQPMTSIPPTTSIPQQNF